MTEQRKISIKRLKVDELSIVADIARKTWPSAYSGIITDEQIEFMLGKMYSLETMSSEVEIKGICFDLLEINNTPAGFASFGPVDNNILKLHKLYILPDFQHQGLGSALLNHVLIYASDNGYKEIILNVNKQNTQAVNAYKKFGFTVKEEVVLDIGNSFVMDDYILSYHV